eukprot:2409526-Rhodomonas_salina.3
MLRPGSLATNIGLCKLLLSCPGPLLNRLALPELVLTELYGAIRAGTKEAHSPLSTDLRNLD